jgi:2-oxoisovalerate dehydrogenase E1 component alpha subunit
MGAHFHVDFLQLLSPEGELSAAAPEFVKDTALLLHLFEAMTRARAFDGKAIALQRTGQLGTFASALGQEAVGVGVASAMRPEDVLVPSYRDHAGQMVRGMSMTECLLYWGGDERGNAYAAAPTDFPCCIPVATQVPHAVGVAYSFKLRRQPRVAVSIIGDGGTSNGAFYEGLNMAGVLRTPLVVVINNNRWAISTPREKASAAETLAQKAVAVALSLEFGVEIAQRLLLMTTTSGALKTPAMFSAS